MKKIILSATLVFALSSFAGVMAQDNKSTQKDSKNKTECCQQKCNKDGKTCCDKSKGTKDCCTKSSTDTKDQKSSTSSTKK